MTNMRNMKVQEIIVCKKRIFKMIKKIIKIKVLINKKNKIDINKKIIMINMK